MKKSEIEEKAARLCELKADARNVYREIDEIEAVLLPELHQADGAIALKGKRTLRLKDNFAGPDGQPKNVLWKNVCAKRFEVVLE